MVQFAGSTDHRIGRAFVIGVFASTGARFSVSDSEIQSDRIDEGVEPESSESQGGSVVDGPAEVSSEADVNSGKEVAASENVSDAKSDAKAGTEKSGAAGAEKSAAVSGKPVLDWYILKVAFNREDSIKDALLRRVAMAGLEEFFGEILVPTEDVVEFTRTGKRRVAKKKLYPGYLMAQIAVTDDSWFLVRETPGVGDFTGAGGKPTPMEPEDVERIIKLVHPDEDEEQAPRTAIPFKIGDKVRVKEGNFQNLEGDVDKIDEANGRVTVIITMFGRSTPVDLDHWQIESV